MIAAFFVLLCVPPTVHYPTNINSNCRSNILTQLWAQCDCGPLNFNAAVAIALPNLLVGLGLVETCGVIFLQVKGPPFPQGQPVSLIYFSVFAP